MINSSLGGFWEATGQTGDTDYLFVDSERGRIVHRINYDHGVFLMKLWITADEEADSFTASLNPGAEPHALKLEHSDEKAELKMEHYDLTVPDSVFDPVGEKEVPDSFTKDVAWANRTMDSTEKKLLKKKK